MTEVEFKKVFKMAQNQDYPQTQAFYNTAMDALVGCAYEKKICTKTQAAYVFNYQTLMFNGERDQSAVEEIYHYYKKNVKILD